MPATALAGPSQRQGPQIGNNKYEGSLVPDGATADVDDFVQDLLAGELLSVTVAAQKDADGTYPLSPLLTLVDPDGIVRSAGITLSPDGRTSTVRSFPIDKSGRWAARIEGRNGSQGRYRVEFRLVERAVQRFKKQRLGNDLPFSRTHTFSAFEGALLDAVITYDNRGLPVEFRALEDPQGDDVLVTVEGRVAPVEAVTVQVTKRNKVYLENVPLSVGDGTYSMRVRIPTAEGRYDLTLRARTAPRPKTRGTSVLTDTEPSLVPRQVPIGGDVGDTVQFTGTNFSTNAAPRVLFGKSQSATVSVSADGTTVTAVVPPRSGATVVPVSIVNPDGQVAYQDVYFAYIPAPEFTNVIDPATSADVRAATTGGGRVIKLVGKNLLAGQVVKFGSIAGTAYTAAADTLSATVTTPVLAEGNYPISVTDQFGRTAVAPFTFFFKTPPAFAANPYSPAALKLNTSSLLTITGSGFSATDSVIFNGLPIPSGFVNTTTRTILFGGLGVGSYPLRIVDSIGTIADGPTIDVKLPPSITTVSVTAGPVIAPIDVPIYGGGTVRVDGANFLSSDTVTVGSTTVTSFLSRTATAFTFTAPANLAGGFATISVTDGAGQVAAKTNAIHYAGLADVTATRGAAGSATDDFGASRGAAADLDADGRDDDVVITSTRGDGAPGTRSHLTRILFGNNGSGALDDKTATNMPAVRIDATKSDVYDAACVAIGDLDKATGNDIVIGGIGGSYYGNYAEVRLLKNNGSGTFTLDAKNSAPSRYQPGTYAYLYGQSYYKYTVYSSVSPAGDPTAMAIGDLDKDGDADLVVGFDHYDQKYVNIDPNSVYSTKSYPLPTITYPFQYIREFRYIPAVRVFRNSIPLPANAGLVDTSATALPSAGTSTDIKGQPSALHSRDLVLGDIDKDGDLDLVLTWDDPTTTTAYGLFSQAAGLPPQGPQASTQVLLNNGTGGFTNNVTGTWMPAVSGAEFWQAQRCRLADLDNDGDLDLVLLLKTGLNAYTGTETHVTSSLRVLRNDGNRFTNVTASAIPAVDTFNADDWRGESLLVRDVSGDGFADILVGTTEALLTSASTGRRTRLFTGATGLRFTRNDAFLPDVSVDTGEAQDAIVSPDLGGTGKNTLLYLTEPRPGVSPSSERLRTSEWKR